VIGLRNDGGSLSAPWNPKALELTISIAPWRSWANHCRIARAPDSEHAALHKDQIEEELFEQRRDLFSTIDLVCFDHYFHLFQGEGGEEILDGMARAKIIARI